MKYLTEEEEKKLLTVLERRKDAERDYMVIHLLLRTGLRLNEAASLNNGDVRNKAALRVRPETAKRSSAREIPLNKRLRAHIKAYFRLKFHCEEDLSADAPFFVARGGRRLSNRAIYNLVKKWLKIARIDAGYSPHSLRHSFAKRILCRFEHSGNVLPRIQKLLGHKSLDSTGIYIEASKEELLEVVEAL